MDYADYVFPFFSPGDLELVEAHARKQSPERIEELAKIFTHATRVSCVSVLFFHLLLLCFSFPPYTSPQLICVDWLCRWRQGSGTWAWELKCSRATEEKNEIATREGPSHTHGERIRAINHLDSLFPNFDRFCK